MREESCSPSSSPPAVSTKVCRPLTRPNVPPPPPPTKQETQEVKTCLLDKPIGSSCLENIQTKIQEIIITSPVDVVVPKNLDTSLPVDSNCDSSRPYKTLTVCLKKEGAGLGFILEGGKESPLGDRPLSVKKIFKCKHPLANLFC